MFERRKFKKKQKNAILGKKRTLQKCDKENFITSMISGGKRKFVKSRGF